jgi:hypothetical protein
MIDIRQQRQAINHSGSAPARTHAKGGRLSWVSADNQPKPLNIVCPSKWNFHLSFSSSTFSIKVEMAWGLWTCPVDCSLPSSQVTKVAPYGDISGPGVGKLNRHFFLTYILTLP